MNNARLHHTRIINSYTFPDNAGVTVWHEGLTNDGRWRIIKTDIAPHTTTPSSKVLGDFEPRSSEFSYTVDHLFRVRPASDEVGDEAGLLNGRAIYRIRKLTAETPQDERTLITDSLWAVDAAGGFHLLAAYDKNASYKLKRAQAQRAVEQYLAQTYGGSYDRDHRLDHLSA